MRKRIFSTLLCFALVVGLLPTGHVHAEWEEGEECYFCGEYIWGDCGDGATHCGENSDHVDCYEDNHCFECEKALQYNDEKCEECGTGYECCLSGYREYCENCGVCAYCLPFDSICPVCGWCIECTGASKLCEMCGVCYECRGGECSEGEDHPCWACHETYVCIDCGQCLLNPDTEEDTLEWCSECHRCENCAEKCAAWGEGHYYCLEEHDDYEYCPDCGHCYLVDIINAVPGKTYGCEDCNKCANCVSAVCKECGKCYDCVEICERCGEYCLDCHEGHGTVCERCGMCFKGVGGHKDCGICWECLESCPECGRCMECEDEIHCPSCGACSGKKGGNGSAELCEICHFCDDCAPHCDDCETCVECEPDTHCSNCYAHHDYGDGLCPDCGQCGDCADICEDCGYCVDCADEDEHCSECHEAKTICDACGMCDECAKEENQHCGESDCDNCYEEYIYCPICDKCIECIGEDNYCYDCFQCKSHHADNPGGKCDGNGTHTHKWSDWKATDANHWQACLLCKETRYTAAHTYKKDQHTCTVCGYNTDEPFVFTQQPKDARAKVSDPYAEEGDPLHVYSNKVTFRVAVTAFQKGTLSYQWYKVEGTTEFKLADDGTGDYEAADGATKAKLVAYVPTDACSAKPQYYCVVTLTDSDGKVLKEAKSDKATLTASHVYDDCTPVSGTTSGTLYHFDRFNNVVHVGYSDSEKHHYTCHGEGDHSVTAADPHGTAKPHTYGDPVLFQASNTSNDPANFVPWYRYTCTECGHNRYVQKHVHQFAVPDDYMTNEDSMAFLGNNCTAETHPMRCTVEGCSAISHEKHEFMIHSSVPPKKDSSGAVTFGSYVLECKHCGYTLSEKELSAANNGRVWGKAFTLVVAKDAAVEVYDSNVLKANSLARPDDTVLLIPTQQNGRMLTGWTAKYTDYTHGESTETVDYSLTVNQREDGNWYFTMPDFTKDGHDNGGYLYLTPTYAEGSCDHSCGTVLVNYKAAVCMNEGYSGDYVCKDCGQILDVDGVGEIIPANADHTGPWVLIDGTKVEADCRHRGYTGDSKCSACGEIKTGTKTGYKHGETELRNKADSTCSTHGNTGDVYCTVCNKTIISGRVLPLNASKHTGRTITVGASDATCLSAGSTGTTTCADCGVTLQEDSRIPALGHSWDAGTVTTDPTTTEPGEMTYKCTHEWKVTLRRGVGAIGGRTVTKQCNGTKTVAIPALGTPTIDSVALTVTAPAVGRMTAAAATTSTECTVANTSWLDENVLDVSLGSAFGAGKTYVVKVELEASGDYAFTPDTTFTLNGENVTVVTRGLDSVTLTYTFPETEKPSSGGSGTSTYAVTVADAKNGTVTADRKTASSGTTVTVTVAPDKGYTLETLSVLDKNGKEVTLTNKGSGKYTFQMPASSVTVKATFMDDNTMLNFFVDVPADAYFADAVLWAAENGITGGMDATHFAPYATCTRAQAVTFLWRAAGCPAPKSTEMPFTDVKADSYYYNAVLWAVENGITKGTTETTFTPNAECSRAQIVTFLWRSQKSPVISAANPFTDVSAEAYYANAVLWAVENGITNGTTAATFTPNANCSRAQIVTFIYRCMK